LRFLFQATAGAKDEDFPDVPSIIELVKTEADRQAVQLLQMPYETQYPFALPPGVPQAALHTYRKAFDLAVTDPEYLAIAKKLNQDIKPQNGITVEAMVQKMANTSPDVKRRVIDLISHD